MPKLQNMKMKNKILFVLSIILVIIFILFLISMYILTNVSKYAKELNNNGVKIIEETENLKTEFVNLRSNTTNVLLSPPKSDLVYQYVDSANENLEHISSDLTDLIGEMESLNIDEQRIDNVKIAKIFFDETYAPLSKALLKVSQDANSIDDVLVEWSNESSAATKMASYIDNIMYESFDHINTRINNGTTLITYIIYGFIGMFALAILISLISALKLGNSLSKRIKGIVYNLSSLTSGDFKKLVDVPGNDEIGKLSQDLNSIVYTIMQSIDDVNTVVQQKNDGFISVELDASNYKGAYKEMMNTINEGFQVTANDNLALISVIEAFAKGDFDVDFPELPNDKQRVNVAIEELRKNLKGISGTIHYFINEASRGNLHLDIHSDRYEGDWHKLATGLDDLLKCIIKPFNDIKYALEEFSNGNTSIQMPNDSSGEYKVISDSFNYCVNEIRKYIVDIDRVLSDISHDNLNTEITLKYNGDFNRIKVSINEIIVKLNRVFDEFLVGADDVSLGAKQIANSSAILADGNSEQVASLQELNAALNLISDKTTNNAEDAKKADNIARLSNEAAGKGNKLMKNMLTSMEDISQSSNEISKIIKVIQDIAFQTNLLALNAAVEAARAGQHGKGFAVVAEEVRNLASRSQTAAKDTTILINTSLSKIVYGSNLAKDTGIALEEIVDSVSEVTQLIENIAMSSEEQSISIMGITKGLKNIEEVVQKTTSSSEEGAAVSEQLSGQALSLRNLIGTFELKG